MIVEAAIRKFQWREGHTAHTTADCQRCGLHVHCYGTKKDAIAKVKLKLHDGCKLGENNLYVRMRT